MTKRGLLCAWGPGDTATSLAQEQSWFLRAAVLLCLGRWRGQHIPELCCGRSKRGTVPAAGSVFPPAVRFTPERPFLNMLSLAPVRCALKMMPEVMPRSDPDRQRGETDCLLVP